MSVKSVLPQIVVSSEQYNRLVRIIQAGDKVRMKVSLVTQFSKDEVMGYNTIAEITGSDKADEIVMVGGHMDSWHSGTGATDNGAGVAAAMEAVRIIQALGLKPRRTIRIGLWSGEEQGLLGSEAYVAQHFGKPVDESKDTHFMRLIRMLMATKIAPGPEYDKLSAYYNLDNGTGKIRGVYLQGNEAVRPIFRQWLQPFRDLGASTLTASNTDGTDHLSFDVIGLPGFQFIQDEIDYETRTHHSNQDVFDRIQADDLKQAATIMAAFIYNTAMRDEKLPRKKN
ncbi:MAG TPA: M20/M25/M40 family metallo-hydrolase [Pyrinomonadaceae bacterium]